MIRLLWVNMTALGSPVVPLENGRHTTSSRGINEERDGDCNGESGAVLKRDSNDVVLEIGFPYVITS